MREEAGFVKGVTGDNSKDTGDDCQAMGDDSQAVVDNSQVAGDNRRDQKPLCAVKLHQQIR